MNEENTFQKNTEAVSKELQWKRLKKLNLVGTRLSYLTKVTLVDRALAYTLLHLIPPGVTPNAITIFRFASIPFIAHLLISGEYGWGLGLFFLSALSDALDGALARTNHQITKWGIVADPLADKLLVGTVAFIMITRYLGWPLTAVIVTIELFLIASSYFRYRGKLMPAKTVGKMKMVLQCVGLCLLLIYAVWPAPIILELARYTLYTAVVFGLGSLLVYRSI